MKMIIQLVVVLVVSVKVQSQNAKSHEVYGQIESKNKKSLIGSEGLTSNYEQMLMNPSNYFISKGLSSQQVDLSHQVVVGHSPPDHNLGYSYGTIEDPSITLARHRAQAFTGDYQEMLHNPAKKMLMVGMHPELSTPNTKQIVPQMEDPIMVVSKEEQQRREQKMQEQLEQREQAIEMYLSTLHEQLMHSAAEVVAITPDAIAVTKDIALFLQQHQLAMSTSKLQTLNHTLIQVTQLLQSPSLRLSKTINNTNNYHNISINNQHQQLNNNQQLNQNSQININKDQQTSKVDNLVLKKKLDPQNQQMTNFIKLEYHDIDQNKEQKGLVLNNNKNNNKNKNNKINTNKSNEESQLQELKEKNEKTLNSLLADEEQLEKSLAKTQELLQQKINRLKSRHH